MAEVIVEGRRLDVMEGLDFSFNYSIADVRDPSKRSTEYSKTIKCPATKRNDELFGNIWDVNISNPNDPNSTNIEANFNPNKKASARVISDGVEVMSGVVQLRKVVMLSGKITYEVVFIGNLVSIFSVFGDKELSGFDEVNGVREYYLDFSAFNHTYDRLTQQASWTATTGEGYVYPMIDWGYNDFYTTSGERIIRVDDFRPALYAKEIIDQMFSFAGFTYTSTFFDSAFFKRLIIPITKELSLPDSAANTRKFKAVKSVSQMMHRLATQFPNTYGNEQAFTNQGIMAKLCFEDEAILGFDNNDQYQMLSSPGNLFNFNADGNYIFKCQQAQRRDVFRASIDLSLKENFAFPFAPAVYNGRMELVRYNDASATIDVIESTDWTWIIQGVVGTVQTQTVYVEGEVTTFINDSVYIRLVADDPTTGYEPDYRLQIGNTVYLDYRCNGGYFENEPVQNRLYEGDEVTLSDHMPDVSMKDFLLGIVNMFNLMFTVNPNDETNILIETLDDFYGSGKTIDWTYKLARDKNVTIEPLGLLTAGKYIYTYSEDGDYYNQRYQNNYGNVYGRRLIDIDNDFLKNTKETSVVFSATPLVNDNPSSRIIPKIYDADIEDGATPTDANIRILYYGGLLPSNPVWHHKEISGDTAMATYPYAGHLTDPITPSQDINFGLTSEIYYSENTYTGVIQVTNNNLVNKYHKKYINEITNKDSKVLTGEFQLTPVDIFNLDFRDQVVIDNSYWRINKVTNYNPFKEGLTKVELIKVIDVAALSVKSATIGSRTQTNGANTEKFPKAANPLRKNLNSFPEFQGTVNGKRNLVRQSTTFFDIIGNDNIVGDGCRNIKILGDSNVVASGLENVVIINSDNQEVYESDVTIIDGHRTWRYVNTTSHYTASDREVVLVDATLSVSDITITLPLLAENLWVCVKRLNETGGNTDITAGVSGNVEGVGTYTLTSQYQSVELYCDGSNWHIRSNA